jgi:hypothetical protein
VLPVCGVERYGDRFDQYPFRGWEFGNWSVGNNASLAGLDAFDGFHCEAEVVMSKIECSRCCVKTRFGADSFTDYVLQMFSDQEICYWVLIDLFISREYAHGATPYPNE